MKKYEVKVRRRNSALSNDWHYTENPIIIEARNQASADNKLDKLARKMNNDYCRLETRAVEM